MLDKIVENSTFPVMLVSSERKKNDTKRRRVSFEIKPVEGNHFHMFKGKGFCYNEYCTMDVVVKALKNYSALPEDLDTYLLINETAQIMANKFNQIFEGFGVKIQFAAATRTAMDQRAKLTKTFYKKFKKEEAVVVEERLNGTFMHFISDRAISVQNDTDVAVLEAFVHFTVQESQGSHVICGLKGVRNATGFKLTNPTIHSTKGTFGSKDKRDAGIYDFRNSHKCNRFCEIFATRSDIERSSDEY